MQKRNRRGNRKNKGVRNDYHYAVLHSSHRGRGDKIGLAMPLARYFLYTGSVLLALLFLIDWYLPSPAVEAARADIDRSTIRLQSAHKWPSAIVYDTNQPTIVPPVATAAVEVPPAQPAEPAKPPLEAMAMAQPKEPAAAPAASHKRVVRRSKLARNPAPAPRVASSDMFGFGNPFQANW
jgi:hypothetical protein